MSFVKPVVACGLAAILLSACGITQKPEVGTSHINSRAGNHGIFDDPRKVHKSCLRKLGLGVHEYWTGKQRLPAIQVGTAPADPTIVFYPTSPELLKIEGKVQGAIMIGASLVYPNDAHAKLAQEVITCIDKGVPG